VSAGLLHYRPWRGDFRPPLLSFWPIARTGLVMIFRRKLFWGLYGLGLGIFLLFFFGHYLLAWAASAGMGTEGFGRTLGGLLRSLQRTLKLDGSAETYSFFMKYQVYIVMAVLALAGSVLVGNDLHHGSLPFYLSKPISRWHYLLGKLLAVGVFVNMLTTLPAAVLWVEYGLVPFPHVEGGLSYFLNNVPLLLGIAGYGLVQTLSLSLLLLATALWLKRTAPLIMAWATMFVFFPLLGTILVDRLHYDPRWKLMDLWTDANLVGRRLLGLEQSLSDLVTQPAWTDAVLVLGGVCLLCLSYLVLRIRAVEVVR
jgi:ABC-type transport system involved in multi-copper enzyme maturation permease subunit